MYVHVNFLHLLANYPSSPLSMKIVLATDWSIIHMTSTLTPLVNSIHIIHMNGFTIA